MHRLADHQMINHFPNHFQLTRKDLLYKNLRRYRKEQEKEGNALYQQDAGRGLNFEFCPLSFILPADYSLFVEEFRKNPTMKWIMKPAGKCQGIGVYIITNLKQTRKFAQQSELNFFQRMENHVISQYIDQPLLVGGKKFDLRLYVLVTSYKPLRCFKYRHGFARFCTVNYSNEVSEIDNQLIHLTNVAVQKHGEGYNSLHGGKLHVEKLALYMLANFGREASERCWEGVDAMIVQSLKACQSVIHSDKHCFECYGFDILLDSNLRPWLIEVNASPSLSGTTENDRSLKNKLIHDVLNLVIPPDFPDGRLDTESFRDETGKISRPLGDFTLLYDEEEEKLQQQRDNEQKRRSGRRYSTSGRLV
jgi:tubulin polyglutamylase TTLL1